MQVSSSHHCERTNLSKVSVLAKGQINAEWCPFAMLKVDKFGRHRRPCVKKILWLLMPSSDGLQESTHYRESRCLFQFRARMSRGLNKFCHAERTIVSMSFRSLPVEGAVVQQSSSYINYPNLPVPNRDHTCRCQAVTTVREPFSPKLPFSKGVRSMKSVSFAILRKLELADLRPCVGMSLVADAAVLKLPGILYLSGIMLPVPIPSKNKQSIAQLLPC